MVQKQRVIVYIKTNPKKNEIVYSGIEFAEFIRYLQQPIENLMIITGGCGCISGSTKYERGLELFEGYELVQKLTEKSDHIFGDFCFVDYSSPKNTEKLSEEQIAELLYLGHVFKSLHSPFFEALQNRFAYLAHDDGWYCKLYCKDLNDFIPVLCNKITSSIDVAEGITDVIGEELFQLTTKGILFDLDKLCYKEGKISLEVYLVGEFLNMDTILNNLQKVKEKASKICILQNDEKGWNIS